MNVKNHVLKRLEENRGVFISGETLSAEAGISRQAVWKAVRSLISDGYAIISVTNKGYKLDGKCDLLSSSLIEEKTGATVYCYDTVTSTNDEARVKYDGKTDCIVVADSQTAGRKKNGGEFISPTCKGVYMSVATRLSFKITQSEEIRRSIASTVAGCLEKICNVAITVKEGDELYLGGKKVCGILVEAQINLATLCSSDTVIGIGIYTAEVNGGLGFINSPETRNSLVSDIYLNLKERLKI